MTWLVGASELQADRLYDHDGEVTTGTATVKYLRVNGGVLEYLQADETTFNPTPYDAHPAPYDAAYGFGRFQTIPASAEDYNISWVMTHSVYGEIASGEEFVLPASAAGANSLDIYLEG